MGTYKVTGTTVGPQAGTCPECAQTVPVVNYRAASWPLPEGGYLARHWRPGLRQGYKCRGSFGVWLERVAK